jgi:hypothetical protein
MDVTMPSVEHSISYTIHVAPLTALLDMLTFSRNITKHPTRIV